MSLGSRYSDYNNFAWVYNQTIREGIRRADDCLPQRASKMPGFGKYSSVAECEIKDYEQMLDGHYQARGWSRETGIPTKEKLQQMGLGALVER